MIPLSKAAIQMSKYIRDVQNQEPYDEPTYQELYDEPIYIAPPNITLVIKSGTNVNGVR